MVVLNILLGFDSAKSPGRTLGKRTRREHMNAVHIYLIFKVYVLVVLILKYFELKIVIRKRNVLNSKKFEIK